LIGEISALACAVLWAFSSILLKSMAGKFDSMVLNFLRCLAASIALWGIIPFSPGIQALWQAPWNSILYLILSAVIGIAVGDTIYFRGLKLINISIAFPIAQSTLPLFTIVAAVLFLGETITWPMLLGTALVLVGIYLIAAPVKRKGLAAAIPAAEKKGMGIFLILIASLLWTVSVSLLKVGLQGVNLILANGIRMPIVCLSLIFFILFQKTNPQSTKLQIRNVAIAASTGIISYAAGGILFLQGVFYAGAAKTTVLTTAAPLFGLPLSIVFLKERVTREIVVGTILVVLGIALIM
jgi:drug/metabolite transporter (DMT)-like permease